MQHTWMRVQVVRRLFVLGTLLGLLWEAPLSAPGWVQDTSKLLRLLKPVSMVALLSWCSWDALIMLVRLRAPPICFYCLQVSAQGVSWHNSIQPYHLRTLHVSSCSSIHLTCWCCFSVQSLQVTLSNCSGLQPPWRPGRHEVSMLHVAGGLLAVPTVQPGPFCVSFGRACVVGSSQQLAGGSNSSLEWHVGV